MGRSTVQLRRIVPITAAAQLRHHRDLWTFDGSNANLKRTPAQDEYQRWGHQVTTHSRYGKDFGMGSTQPIQGATKQGTIPSRGGSHTPHPRIFTQGGVYFILLSSSESSPQIAPSRKTLFSLS